MVKMMESKAHLLDLDLARLQSLQQKSIANPRHIRSLDIWPSARPEPGRGYSCMARATHQPMTLKATELTQLG